MAERGPDLSTRRGIIPYGVLAAVVLPVAAAVGWDLREAEGLRFAHPWMAVPLVLAVALVLYVAFWRAPGRHAVLIHARASELGRMKKGWASRLRDLPLVLRLVTIVLIGLALARPQTAQLDDDVELEGIDIVVALDASGSMEETDLVPNRLEAAKAVIQDFVKRRPSDRIGLVLFGRDAYTHIPLTLDHGTFIRMLSELYVGIIDGKGTAIGNGIGVALARLRRSEARSKVIILLTDGDNNAGNISPLEAAKIAQKLGVKIYTILAGARDSAAEGDDAPRGPRQRYPVNPKLLEEIATMTGGSPYLASDTNALARRFQSIIDDLEKSRIKDRAVQYAELYPRFLWPAFGLLMLELALRLTRLRRLP